MYVPPVKVGMVKIYVFVFYCYYNTFLSGLKKPTNLLTYRFVGQKS